MMVARAYGMHTCTCKTMSRNLTHTHRGCDPLPGGDGGDGIGRRDHGRTQEAVRICVQSPKRLWKLDPHPSSLSGEEDSS